MNIDLKAKTITCDCGLSTKIIEADLFHCPDCESFHFDCDRCKATYSIPFAFNNFIQQEIAEKVPQSERDFRDIFLGDNQVPLTDDMIDYLEKEKGFPRKELEFFKQQGARYSVSRNSLVLPGEMESI